MPIDETPLPYQPEHPSPGAGAPQYRQVRPRRMHSLSTARLWWTGATIAVLAAGLGAATTGLIMASVQSNQTSTQHEKFEQKDQGGQGSGQQKHPHASPTPTTQSQNN